MPARTAAFSTPQYVRSARKVGSVPTLPCSPHPAFWVILERRSVQARAPPAPPLPSSVVRPPETRPRFGSSKRGDGALPPGESALGAVAEVHDTVADGVPPAAPTGRGRRWGTRACLDGRAPDKCRGGTHRPAGVERECCEGRPAGGGCLQFADRIGVEATFEPRLGGRDCVQRRGVDDLVGRCQTFATAWPCRSSGPRDRSWEQT